MEKKHPTREEEIEHARICKEKRELEEEQIERDSMNLVLDAVENWIRKIIMDATNDRDDYAIDAMHARENLIEVLERELKG